MKSHKKIGVSPVYISKLSKTDPLFVAENKPELKDLENPRLSRQYGQPFQGVYKNCYKSTY